MRALDLDKIVAVAVKNRLVMRRLKVTSDRERSITAAIVERAKRELGAVGPEATMQGTVDMLTEIFKDEEMGWAS